jgi:hypothetical protein
VTVLDGANLTYHVVRGEGDFLLDGVTITRGNANATGDDSMGGGLFLVRGAPTLRNCRFASNFAHYSGGAVHAQSGVSLVIEGCAFETNRAGRYDGQNSVLARGGAISASSGSGASRPRIAISDSRFSENVAESTGGAIWISGSGACSTCRHRLDLARVTFTGDYADYYVGGDGGVLRVIYTDLVAEDVAIAGAARLGRGGCMDISAGSSVELRNARLSCSGDTAPGGIRNAGTLIVADSAFHNNVGFLGASAIDNLAGASARFHNTSFTGTGSINTPTTISNAGALELVHCTFSTWRSCPRCVVAVSGTGTVLATNSVFWPDTPPSSATYSCVHEAANLAGAGNVPLNASPFDGDTNFLAPNSPCRNAGSNAAADAIGLDWMNLTTQSTGCLDSATVDMGAHFPPAEGAAACP